MWDIIFNSSYPGFLPLVDVISTFQSHVSFQYVNNIHLHLKKSLQSSLGIQSLMNPFDYLKTSFTFTYHGRKSTLWSEKIDKSKLYLLPVGLVVQLVRIHACHAWGRGFESRPDRTKLLTRVFQFEVLLGQFCFLLLAYTHKHFKFERTENTIKQNGIL